MSEPGAIKDITEVKFLILYVLSYCDRPIALSLLSEMLLKDSLVDFFDTTTALSEMLKTGHVKTGTVDSEDSYECTPLGLEAISLFQKTLPYSAREKAIIAAASILKKMKQDSEIVAKFEKLDESRYMVSLFVVEGLKPMFSINLTAPSAEQARIICDNFKNNTAKICSSVIKLLTEET